MRTRKETRMEFFRPSPSPTSCVRHTLQNLGRQLLSPRIRGAKVEAASRAAGSSTASRRRQELLICWPNDGQYVDLGRGKHEAVSPAWF